MGETAKEEMRISKEEKQLKKEFNTMLREGRPEQIKKWMHDRDKLGKEKDKLFEKREAAHKKYIHFISRERNYYLRDHGLKATLAKQQELLHNMQSADQALQEIDSKEAQIKELTAQEKAADQILAQNQKVYNADNFGAKRFVQTVAESSEGSSHASRIATSAQHARAIGNLSGAVTDAKGAEILYRNSMGVSNAKMAEQTAVDTIGATANKVRSAQILGQGYVQQVYSKGSAASQNIMSNFGYGLDSIHSLSAIASTSLLGTRSIIDGEDVYTSFNASTGGFGSDIATSTIGINDTGVYNNDLKRGLIRGFGGSTITQMQNRAMFTTGVADAANVAVSLGGGRIFNAVKAIANNGLSGSLKNIGSVYKNAGINIAKDLGGFKGKAGNKMETIGVDKGQIGGGG